MPKNTFALELRLLWCFLDHRGVHQHPHWDGLQWRSDTGGDAGRILLCTRCGWMVNVFMDENNKISFINSWLFPREKSVTSYEKCRLVIDLSGYIQLKVLLDGQHCVWLLSTLIYSHCCDEGFCRVGVHGIN